MGQAADHPPLHRIVPQQILDRPDVDARRLQQLLADRAAQLRHEVVDLQAGVLEDDLAHQAVAVGVQAAAGQAEHHVAGPDGLGRR